MTLATSIPNNTHPEGKAGEFDFLSGHWTIKHRQLKTRNPDVWDTFDGEATCWSILDGAVSIEELRIPSRNFSGMGLRMFDKEKQVWSDFWVNSRSGAFLAPGVAGGFEDGRGVFVSDETHGDQIVLVRGVWDNITASTCRWQQATSRDGGKDWETNWSMEWTRVE
jgi:hypothetical protein